MSDKDPVPGFKSCRKETIALAWKVGKSELYDLPNSAKRIMLSPQVKQAIKSSILQHVQTKISSGSSIVTTTELKNLANTTQNKVLDTSKDLFLKSMQSSDQYLELTESLKPLEKSFKATKTMVFVDENKGFLYYMLTIATIGGMGTLYQSANGRQLLSRGMESLKDIKFVLPVGNLNDRNARTPTGIETIGEISTKKNEGIGGRFSVLDFKPDARLYAGNLGFDGKLKKVDVDFELGGIVENAKLSSYQGKAIIKFPMNLNRFKSNFTFNSEIRNDLVNKDLFLTCRLKQVGNGVESSVGFIIENGQKKFDAGFMYNSPNKNTTFELNSNLNFNNGKSDFGVFLKLMHKF